MIATLKKSKSAEELKANFVNGLYGEFCLNENLFVSKESKVESDSLDEVRRFASQLPQTTYFVNFSVDFNKTLSSVNSKYLALDLCNSFSHLHRVNSHTRAISFFKDLFEISLVSGSDASPLSISASSAAEFRERNANDFRPMCDELNNPGDNFFLDELKCSVLFSKLDEDHEEQISESFDHQVVNAKIQLTLPHDPVKKDSDDSRWALKGKKIFAKSDVYSVSWVDCLDSFEKAACFYKRINLEKAFQNFDEIGGYMIMTFGDPWTEEGFVIPDLLGYLDTLDLHSEEFDLRLRYSWRSLDFSDFFSSQKISGRVNLLLGCLKVGTGVEVGFNRYNGAFSVSLDGDLAALPDSIGEFLEFDL